MATPIVAGVGGKLCEGGIVKYRPINIQKRVNGNVENVEKDHTKEGTGNSNHSH